MPKHEPSDYNCPICTIAAGGEDEETVVWRDDLSIAVLGINQQLGNEGRILVSPIAHFENIYDLPEQLGAHLFAVTRQLSIAMKRALGCDGITIRQNNEPASEQHVWHYHTHVIPRFVNDKHNDEPQFFMPLQKRIDYARRIRMAIDASAAQPGGQGGRARHIRS